MNRSFKVTGNGENKSNSYEPKEPWIYLANPITPNRQICKESNRNRRRGNRIEEEGNPRRRKRRRRELDSKNREWVAEINKNPRG
jgi:hypothetical protein